MVNKRDISNWSYPRTSVQDQMSCQMSVLLFPPLASPNLHAPARNLISSFFSGFTLIIVVFCVLLPLSILHVASHLFFGFHPCNSCFLCSAPSLHFACCIRLYHDFTPTFASLLRRLTVEDILCTPTVSRVSNSNTGKADTVFEFLNPVLNDAFD